MSKTIENKAKYKRVRCKNCKKLFSAKSSQAKTCSALCRQAHSRSVKAKSLDSLCKGFQGFPCFDSNKSKSIRCRICKRKHSRFDAFFNTSFGSRLANDLLKRAGNVQLIDGMSGLLAYFELHKLLTKANSIQNGKVEVNFHIAHRVAVREAGGKRKGMYSKSNLVVVPAKQNQGFGNKNVFIEAEPNVHFLWSDNLDGAFSVGKDTTHKELRSLLILHLGGEFVDWVDAVNLPRKSKNASGYSSQGLSSLEVAKVQASESQAIALSLDWIRADGMGDESKESLRLKGEALWDGYTDTLSPDERANEQYFQELTGLEFWNENPKNEGSECEHSIQEKPIVTDDW